MKATHTCYKHPKHLRVETGKAYPAWSAGGGWQKADALCLSPSSSDYGRLNRANLPCFLNEAGCDCPIHGACA